MRPRAVAAFTGPLGVFRDTRLLGSTPLTEPVRAASTVRTPARFSMASPSQTTDVSSWTTLSEKLPQLDWTGGPYTSLPSKVWEEDRLYGKFQKKDIRLVFYRDAAYWCPYCERIQLLLERKQIPYTLVKENMRCYGKKNPEFLRMVPSGLLPVVKIDGRVITESLDIMFEIEQLFRGDPYKSTLPVDDNEKMQAFHRFVRLERVMAGAWLNMLRGPQILPQRAIAEFNTTMDLIEKSLGEFSGDFFLSTEEEGPGFIDILFAGFIERIKSSVAYWRNIDIFEGRPRVAAWFAAMERWRPYRHHRSDDRTHILALPPQFGKVDFRGKREDISTLIDRKRTLHVLSDGPEGAEPREEAARAIIRNVDILIPHAIKGGGAEGVAVGDHLDAALRILTEALADPGPGRLEALESAMRNEIPSKLHSTVADCLRFERGKCCTPRDMSIEGMYQFCGVINWALRALGAELE